ncbi:MAG: ASKHA domain-containing protein [Dehalococcoidales bacterium]|nr:ASKHA domain-containing protein [Dehalococcoidales bacterium]
MTEYKVKFLPDGKEVEVVEGTTLLEAARTADIYINSLCGGEGLCGECRLQVTSGKARADKNAIGFFSKEEIENGYVLACQTKVEDNLEVLIPAKSLLEEEKIVTEGVPLTYSKPESISLHKRPVDPASFFEPLVSKVYLELREPTLDDNVADIDRITRELGKKTRYPSFEISLACLQNLAAKLRQHNWHVTATVARHNGIGRILQIEGGDTTEQNYGLAVDVGTTTVVVQLVHLKTGKVIGVEGSHNRQARYGEDVISRMVFACSRGSLDPVHEAVISNINALVQALSRKTGIDVKDITSIVAAGNTTMSHFLLGLMPCSIRLEPYVPTATIYPQITAGDIGIDINPQGILEVMPSVASYVGGDIVAGALACGLADKQETQCLVDVGTNGEIAIGNNDWIVCCSASAGPAFEGAGSKWGMRATKGAIEKIRIEEGKVTYETIGNAKPRGICGSGLIDTIYELARNRIIGQDGKLNLSRNDHRIIVGDNEPRYILVFPEETETGEAITISESEIGNLVKSKGAVFAALKSLTDYVGLTFGQLDIIYIAGGFGSSLDISKAIAIGLLPDIDTSKIQFIGNSSVMGARMALLSAPAFEKAINIAKKMTNIELSNYLPFMNEFVAALFLPHTDSSLFPSVHY